MRLPITVPSDFCIIAHRGASAYAPENSILAFDLALRMARPHVELDAQLTTDGRVALCHDSTLARYGHGDQTIESLDWATLAGLDMGAWFSPYLYAHTPMITLDQLFAYFGDRLFYHVEIKGKAPGLPAAVHKLIRDAGLEDSCNITSFAYDALVAMRRVAPAARLGWLIPEITDAAVAQADALGLHQLCPRAAQVDAAAVKLARTVAPEVRAWGLMGTNPANPQHEVADLIERVVDAGCDGMTINWPDWAVNA
ncbi:MAG: glycerophosphodiester phosphodiesterase [Litorilinea sp.]